jgi:hypothetical protein
MIVDADAGTVMVNIECVRIAEIFYCRLSLQGQQSQGAWLRNGRGRS